MKRFFPVVPRESPAKRQKDDGPPVKDVADGETSKILNVSSGQKDTIASPIEAEGSLERPGKEATAAALANGTQNDADEKKYASIFRRSQSSAGAGVAGAPSTSGSERTGKSPTSFMSWNTNSFIIRMKSNKPELVRFVELHDPDVIAIQEVS
jgi:hypothetical protein